MPTARAPWIRRRAVERKRAPFTLREFACLLIAWAAGVSFVALVAGAHQ